MSKQKMGLIAMAIMAAGVFAWVVMTQGPLAPVKVTVDKVKTGHFSNEVFGIGTIEARRSYNLAPTMTSRINKVLVDQGDHVTAGQVLAEMDPLDLGDKVVSSQQVAERAANAVRMADAQLLEAKSRARNVLATFNRFTELRARGFVSQESLDAKQHEKDAAEPTELLERVSHAGDGRADGHLKTSLGDGRVMQSALGANHQGLFEFRPENLCRNETEDEMVIIKRAQFVITCLPRGFNYRRGISKFQN